MRILAIWTLLIAFSAGATFASDETLEQLKSHADTAPLQDRTHLRLQIAELQLRNADKFFKDGDSEHGRAALDDIVTNSQQARDAAIEMKKHLQNVEIAARKIAERLRNIKRTVVLEDQASIDQAVQHLEEVRTSLLQHMFSKEKDKEKK